MLDKQITASTKLLSTIASLF